MNYLIRSGQINLFQQLKTIYNQMFVHCIIEVPDYLVDFLDQIQILFFIPSEEQNLGVLTPSPTPPPEDHEVEHANPLIDFINNFDPENFGEEFEDE